MAETTMTVHMKPSTGRLALYRNGMSYGGSVDREGILQVLLNVVRTTPGFYQVVDEQTGEVLLTYDTDQPVWSDVTIEKHQSKMPMSPRHGWKRASFSTSDEPDDESTFQGFHDGSTWNGWSQPHMERVEVERVIAYVSGVDDAYEFTWKYDCLVIDCKDAEEVQVIYPRQVFIDGDKRMLYDMSLGWIWQEVD